MTADDRLSRGRATIEERPGGLLVTVPAKRIWFVALFWTVWSIGVLSFVVTGVVNGEGGVPGALFSVVFLVVAIALLGAVAWMLVGREEAELTSDRLVLRRRLGPLKRERTFDRAKITDLRADPNPASIWAGDMRSFGVTGGGAILFDYGMRTHNFAAALEQAEAKHVAGRLQEALR